MYISVFYVQKNIWGISSVNFSVAVVVILFVFFFYTCLLGVALQGVRAGFEPGSRHFDFRDFGISCFQLAISLHQNDPAQFNT